MSRVLNWKLNWMENNRWLYINWIEWENTVTGDILEISLGRNYQILEISLSRNYQIHVFSGKATEAEKDLQYKKNIVGESSNGSEIRKLATAWMKTHPLGLQSTGNSASDGGGVVR